MDVFITIVIAVIGTGVALIQLYKWGVHKRVESLCKLIVWSLNKDIGELKKVYEKSEPHILTMGKRHKIIREQYLSFSLNEMSRFYDVISPSEIEEYEQGKKDIPFKSIEKLRSFFSINKSFLDNGDHPIFEEHSSGLSSYIEDGYEAIILCPPRKESEEFAIDKYWSFLFLSKIVDGFERSFQYGSIMNFYSTGGGKGNVERLIKSFLVNEKNPSHVRIIEVDFDTWSKAKKDKYYLKDEKLISFLADFDNQDTYLGWVDEVIEKI